MPGSGEEDVNPTFLSDKGEKFCIELRCHKIREQGSYLRVGGTNNRDPGGTEEGHFALVWSDKEKRQGGGRV